MPNACNNGAAAELARRLLDPTAPSRNGRGEAKAPAITPMTIGFNEHLGGQLRSRRRSLGLTQTQLATAIGLRFQQIQKYECGASKMSAKRIWELAQALDVPVGYFYEGLTR